MTRVVDNAVRYRSAPGPSPAAKPIRRRRRLRIGAPGIALLVLLVYLVIGPIAMLLLSGFENTTLGVVIRPPFPWTLENFVKMLTTQQTYSVLLATAVFAFASLLISFVISFALAWLVERTDIPLPGFIYVLTVAPTGMPGMISAIAWGLLANPVNGVLNLMLRPLFHAGASTGPLNVYSMPGMIAVQSIALVPLSFLLITASLRSMNPSLEDAARASGAGPLRVLARVSIPLLTPVLVGAIVYQFVTVIEGVDIPLILGLPGHVTVFSTEVYTITHPAFGLPDYGLSSAYGILLLVIALAPLILYNRVLARAQDYATVTGKAFRPRRARLGAWRWVAFAAVMVYVAITFVLPLIVLLYGSLEPYIGAFSLSSLERLTLSGWTNAFHSHLFWSSLSNTLVIGLVSSVLVMALSLGLSWIIVRTKSRIAWLADILAFLPHAMPGIVIGLAVLLIYLLIPGPIYGSIWIVVIAMTTQYLSLGTRLTTGGIAQIQVGLEEAGRTSGANAARVWLRVLLPLLRPVLLNGFLLVFLTAIKNLTLPLMLQSSTNTVMATEIWNSWNDGKVTQTAVLSVILTAVTVVASILLRRFGDAGDDRL
ncbi:MAG TPA: iron ABC transporter permease [Gryllotalpicola sp.]